MSSPNAVLRRSCRVKNGRKPARLVAGSGVIRPSADRAWRATPTKAGQLVKPARSNTQKEQPGGDSRGRGERGSRKRRNEYHWSDDQRPSDRPVPGDLDQVVEVEQQRPDRDRDRREHPVAVTGGNHDD